MLDFESLMSGARVPTVGADDVRRVWKLMTEAGPHVEPAGAIGIDIGLIAKQCGEGADPIAVFFRTALLQPLLQRGLLDDWRDGCIPAS